jgi:phage tail protein X
MTIVGFELHTVASEYVSADLIIWKKYMGRAIGMFELMLDANPQLSVAHRRSPFIPVGVYVRVPIDPEKILGKPQVLPQDSLWTDRQGMQLRGASGPSTLPQIIE